MDSSGNIYSEEDLKKMQLEDKDKLSGLGKLIEIYKEDENVFNMDNDDRRKWYQKMVNKRKEFPIPK